MIAGSGASPAFILDEAHKRGYSCVVAGIREEADPELETVADAFGWFDAFDIESLSSFFKRNGINRAVFAGKIEHQRIYEKGKEDKKIRALLSRGPDNSPTALIQGAIELLAEHGIEIVDPTEFTASAFCQEGVLTQRKIPAHLEEDIVFGWKTAKELADLDIGQTVVVKDRAVVALEGMEGTDETIIRGGQLAGGGTVVIKVSRSSQDPRIDLPAVGLSTVESMIQAHAMALVFEADKVLFFQKEKAVALAKSHDISIVAKRSP
jgi:DUF1009 family protein